jgi:hypothetical protein
MSKIKRYFYIYIIAVFTLMLTACITRPQPPEIPIIIAEGVLKDLQGQAVALQHERQKRITEVWYRLTSANAQFCDSRVKGSLGVGLGYNGLYAKPFHESYQRLYGIGSTPQIIYMHPKGAAAKAGLREGDQIIAVDGKILPKRSADNIDLWLQDNLLPILGRKKQVRLTVQDQQGAKSTTTVYPKPVCRHPIKLLSVNAISASEVDNLRVYITTGMVRFLKNDDQLAWILGHELAHITLHSKGSNEKSEFLADYVGSYFTARAGYDPEEILEFWQRWAAEDPPAIALEGHKTHPSIAIRIGKIMAVAKEIQEKLAKNMQLEPNLDSKHGVVSQLF